MVLIRRLTLVGFREPLNTSANHNILVDREIDPSSDDQRRQTPEETFSSSDTKLLVQQKVASSDTVGLSIISPYVGAVRSVDARSSNGEEDFDRAGSDVDLTGEVLLEIEDGRSAPDTGASIKSSRGSFTNSMLPLDIMDDLASFGGSLSQNTSFQWQASSKVARPRSIDVFDENEPWADLTCSNDYSKDPFATEKHVSQGNDDYGKSYLRATARERPQSDPLGLDLFERSIRADDKVAEDMKSPAKCAGQAELLRYEQRQSRISLMDHSPPRSVPPGHESPSAKLSLSITQSPSEFKFPSRQLGNECPTCPCKLQAKGAGRIAEAHAVSCESMYCSRPEVFNSPLTRPSEHGTSHSNSSDLLLELVPTVTTRVTAAGIPRRTRDNLRESKITTLIEDPIEHESDLSSASKSTFEDDLSEEKITLDFNPLGRAAWARLTEMAKVDY